MSSMLMRGYIADWQLLKAGQAAEYAHANRAGAAASCVLAELRWCGAVLPRNALFLSLTHSWFLPLTDMAWTRTAGPESLSSCG